MRVTAERTIEDLYREQALGSLRFALLTCSLPPGGVQTWMLCAAGSASGDDGVQVAFRIGHL
jgi:hypothetical protein